MLKALEVLRRELQNNYEKRPFVIKTELYHKERIEDFHEAIDELEALQNRSCDNCLYFSNSGYGFGLCNKGVSSDFKIGTFYCNKWEVKNECS